MRASKLWLAALPLALAACGGDDAAETNAAAGDSATVPAAPAPAADTTPAAGAAGGAMGNSTVQLAAVGNSGVSGSAMLGTEGTGTKVTLDLTGFKSAGSSAAHVHQGTCESPGEVVAPLTAVQVDDSGNGSSITTLQIPMETVMNGQHIVAAHEIGGNPGAPVTCAPIPGHSM